MTEINSFEKKCPIEFYVLCVICILQEGWFLMVVRNRGSWRVRGHSGWEGPVGQTEVLGPTP